MKQVKVFEANAPEKLEELINGWIQENADSITVIAVMYSCARAYSGAMVLYSKVK